MQSCQQWQWQPVLWICWFSCLSHFGKINLNMGNSQLQCFLTIQIYMEEWGELTPFFTSNVSLMIWNNYTVQYQISPTARNCVQITSVKRNLNFFSWCSKLKWFIYFEVSHLQKKKKKKVQDHSFPAVDSNCSVLVKFQLLQHAW